MAVLSGPVVGADQAGRDLAAQHQQPRELAGGEGVGANCPRLPTEATGQVVVARAVAVERAGRFRLLEAERGELVDWRHRRTPGDRCSQHRTWLRHDPQAFGEI